MNKLLRYFLTFVATVAILIPSLGFKLVKHTCNTCNTVEFNLFDSGNCAGCKVFEVGENGSSCCDAESAGGSCGINGEDNSCCVYDISEPNIDSFVLPAKSLQELQPEYIEILLVFFEFAEIKDNSSQLLNYKDPPTPYLTGIDFLFFINQLKIPNC